MKYKAFISYSHNDGRWGRRLHRRLEVYRVPQAIVGTKGRDGPVPERLGTIFRDREELPTSADLGTALVEALDSSEYLIVICSPSSGNSRWVNEEILHFKRTGRENKILPFIIQGEPNASDMGDINRECFPSSLRFKLGSDGKLSKDRFEPIAADARSEGDGPNDAILKLIAGLLGIDFDALKQREQRRKKANTLRVRVLVTIIAFIVVGSALVANTQHKRAESASSRVTELTGVAERYKGQWAGAGVGSEITPLVDAVLLNDVNALKNLPISEAELNEFFGPDQLTPLMIACKVGHSETVEWLLRNGSDDELYNPEGFAALHIAADSGRPEVFASFKEHGANLDIPWHAGGWWRPMDIAAERGHVLVIDELIRLGVKIEIVPFRDGSPSPLFAAAWFNQAEVILALIKHGAKTDVVEEFGDSSRTPYITALQSGSVDAALVLSDVSGVERTETLGRLLHYPVIWNYIYGSSDISDINRLIDLGADVNFLATDGTSLLMEAASKFDEYTERSSDVIELLLSAGADPSVGTEEEWDSIYKYRLETDESRKALAELLGQ